MVWRQVLTVLATGLVASSPVSAQPSTLTSARAASAVLAPTARSAISPALTVAPATASYTPLPAAQMAQVTRQINAQLAGVLRSPSTVVKPFAGTVQLPSAAPGGPVVQLVPLALVDDPLRFDSNSGRFEGRIAVGLVEVGHTGPAKALAEAIRFQILGDVSTNPEVASVSSTAPPFALIRVSARDPRDAVALQVMTNLAAQPVQLSLPVARARLELRAKHALQGFGLESAEVVISASDGPASRGQSVTLTLDKGSLGSTQAKLRDDGTASVTLRSESTGGATLTASSTQHQEGQLSLRYELPWRSTLAALLGGVSGGLLRGAGAGRARWTRRVATLALAVLCGAVVYALSVLGVNLFGVALPAHGGEVLAFVVSALGAFGGTRLLEAATRRP